jgi:hypothetical protein
MAGGDILSHPFGAVPSALSGLTSLFGMGRGGSRSLLPPTALIRQLLVRFMSIDRLSTMIRSYNVGENTLSTIRISFV